MFKKWHILLFIIVLSFSLTACANDSAKTTVADSKVQVTVSFNAMKEFVDAVGGDLVEVTTIIPDGTEPHDFEMKAQDIASLSNAAIFVYNGLGMEQWADEGADAIAHTEEEEIEEHGQYDPHLWLSLKGAQTEIENIKNALVEADPSNKDAYETNYQYAAEQLDSLYQEYTEKFQSTDRKNFVTGHAAFGYLCRDFGLEQNSVEDIFAEGEPSAQQLAELVDYCLENNVTTVFAEELASPDVSETLANEVGAKVETIYTIESAEDSKSYLERMRENLEKIYVSLTD
jgi:zinc transport system substrate-binding protein